MRRRDAARREARKAKEKERKEKERVRPREKEKAKIPKVKAKKKEKAQERRAKAKEKERMMGPMTVGLADGRKTRTDGTNRRLKIRRRSPAGFA